MKFKSPIKWSGSKSPLAEEIVNHFPILEKGGTYYEPFCGSCAVLFELLTNPKHENKRTFDSYVCSDLNSDLINLWNCIKTAPDLLSKYYITKWNSFNLTDHYSIGVDISTETLYRKRKKIFYDTKKIFNQPRCNSSELIKVCRFLFLLRTSFNGLLRYNKKGEYNSTCHFSRPGIHPDKLDKILHNTSDILNKYDVQFIHQSYTNITNISEKDLFFLDPPYSDTGSGGKSMYYGNINEQDLINFCDNLPCSYILTYNGDRGDNYGDRLKLKNVKEILLESKTSSYSRMNGKNVKVSEIMYVKIPKKF